PGRSTTQRACLLHRLPRGDDGRGPRVGHRVVPPVLRSYVVSGNAAAKLAPGLPGREPGGEAPEPVLCQICGQETVPGLDLGHHPVGALVVATAELNEPETFYPMRLHHCHGCGLTQLGYVVDPAVVYKHFPFVSGTTQTATRHLQNLASTLVEMGNLDAG